MEQNGFIGELLFLRFRLRLIESSFRLLPTRCIWVCCSMCSCVTLLGSSNVYVEDVGVSVACNGLIGKLSLLCPKKVNWLDIDTCSVSLRFHSCCYPHDGVNLEKCRTWLSLKRCLFYHDGFRFTFHLFFAMTRGVKMWTNYCFNDQVFG
jgi:hypothetical protein